MNDSGLNVFSALVPTQVVRNDIEYVWWSFGSFCRGNQETQTN